MTKMSVEIEGSVGEVIAVLRRLGTTGRHATAGDAAQSTDVPVDGVVSTTPSTGTSGTTVAQDAAPGEWTETLARDFLAVLQPTARRMALHVWRAGAAGIHRSALCQRAELTPAELRSLQMQMGHALGRFQRERGMTLPRPVAANSPLQSYFVDPDFAAVADSQMFGDGMLDRPVDDVGRPGWVPVAGRQGEPVVRRLRNALTMMACLWLSVACGMDVDDRMVRRYAECMVNPNTTLHRLMVSGAVGTVALSADAVKERLQARLSRGEVTMAEIRAGHARYCE